LKINKIKNSPHVTADTINPKRKFISGKTRQITAIMMKIHLCSDCNLYSIKKPAGNPAGSFLKIIINKV